MPLWVCSPMQSRNFLTELCELVSMWPWLMRSGSSTVTSLMYSIVYDDLSHPLATYIGPEYQYHRAYESHNNICDPDMGKAGMPYAHSWSCVRSPLRCQKVGFFLYHAHTATQFFSLVQAPCWTVQYDDFVHHACHPHISLITIIWSYLLCPCSDYCLTTQHVLLYKNMKKRLNKIHIHDGHGLTKPDTFAKDPSYAASACCLCATCCSVGTTMYIFEAQT